MRRGSMLAAGAHHVRRWEGTRPTRRSPQEAKPLRQGIREGSHLAREADRPLSARSGQFSLRMLYEPVIAHYVTQVVCAVEVPRKTATLVAKGHAPPLPD